MKKLKTKKKIINKPKAKKMTPIKAKPAIAAVAAISVSKRSAAAKKANETRKLGRTVAVSTKKVKTQSVIQNNPY